MKRIILIIAAVAAACAGCKKFLEPWSQSEATPSRIDQLAELILTGLPEPNDKDHSTLTGGYLDLMSDDVQARPTIPASVSAGQMWNTQSYLAAIGAIFTWQPDYSQKMRDALFTNNDGLYVNHYNKLEYANSVLDLVEEVSGTRVEKDYVKAQALTLRGFYYLNLVNLYGQPYTDGRGGMGVPLRLTGAKENKPMTRNTVGEVYDRITTDLADAIALFETLPARDQYRNFRPTMPMAMLLLARAYLYMGDWAQAEYWAQRLTTEWTRFKIVDLNTLVNNGVTNFTPDTPLRQLLWNKFVSYADGGNSDVIWAYGAGSDPTNLAARDLNQTGGNATSGTTASVLNNGIYASMLLASADLVNSYGDNDLRLRTYLIRDLFAEPTYNASSTLAADTKFQYYKAYSAKVNITQSASGLPDNNHTFKPSQDQPVGDYGYTLRITEAWLILAEARAEQGKTGEARAALREVQKNRFAGNDYETDTKYNSGNVINDVRAERRREFCFESLRWFDMRRWGKKEVKHVWYDYDRNLTVPRTYVLQADDPAFTLPLTFKVLEQNTHLVQVPTVDERLPQ